MTEAAAPDIVLSEEELARVTGYRRAAEQVAELHSQGFSRARRDRLGRVVLERTHYEAVTRGAIVAPEPKVRLLVRRS